MYKKIVEFTNLDGNKEKRELYFNITKFELLEWQHSTKEGMQDYLKRIVETEDIQVILKAFKELTLMAYGERVGDEFIKDKEKTEAFAHSEAFSEFVFGLIEDENAAATFVNGILPNYSKPQP